MSQEASITPAAFQVLDRAREDAQMYRNPYITPEHVLFQMESSGLLEENLLSNGKSPSFFRERLGLFLSSLSTVDLSREYAVKYSTALRNVLQDAISFAKYSTALRHVLQDAISFAERDKKPVGIGHLLFSMAGVSNTLAGYLVLNNIDVIKDVVVPSWY